MNDRELDALVAEKVMGWKWHLCHELNNEGEMVYHFRNDEPPDWWKRPTVVDAPTLPEVKGVRLFVFMGVPHYSTDIAAAWEVVEKMRADGWLVTIKVNTAAGQFVTDESRSEFDAPSHQRKVGKTGQCVCELYWMGEQYRPTMWSVADTAPRAICVAALRSIGVEVPA